MIKDILNENGEFKLADYFWGGKGQFFMKFQHLKDLLVNIFPSLNISVAERMWSVLGISSLL